MVSQTTSRHTVSHGDLQAWLGNYDHLHIDIGTGDDTFALRRARECQDMGVIGVDACLDNLVKATRRPLSNLRFIASDALAIPECLYGTATSVSINFPYGSLLLAVASDDVTTWEQLLAVARPGACVDLRINASVGAEYGLSLGMIQEGVERMLRLVAPRSASVTVVPQETMQSFPSTWAKRLAYGRPSRVIVASGCAGV